MSPKHEVLAPPISKVAVVAHAKLSPDGRRLAFAADDGLRLGIHLWPVDSDEDALLASLRDERVTSVHWSRDCERVCYVLETELPSAHHRSIGWARADGFGETGRTRGCVAAWGDDMLFFVDIAASEIAVLLPRTGERRTLCEIVDDGMIGHLPSLAVSPSGLELAYSTRQRYRNLAELWRVTASGHAERVIAVEDANARILPFWHPKGATLGVHVVRSDPAASMLRAYSPKRKDVAIWSSDAPCPAQPATWSPKGGHLAFFTGDGLVTLDLKANALHALDVEDLPPATPRFWGRNAIVVEGGEAVHVIQLDEPL